MLLDAAALFPVEAGGGLLSSLSFGVLASELGWLVPPSESEESPESDGGAYALFWPNDVALPLPS